jgi:hypothetical protein
MIRPGRAAERPLAEAIRQGAYLTNDVDLFRVVAVVSGSSGLKVIELEDCRTLEVHTYSGPGVMALGLTPVRAAAVADAPGSPAYSARSTSAT